jgi:PKD domain/Carbohydrate binding domain
MRAVAAVRPYWRGGVCSRSVVVMLATINSRLRVRVGLILVAAVAGVLWCVPIAAADTDLVDPAGFETGTSGWLGSGFTQVLGGHSGSYAGVPTSGCGFDSTRVATHGPGRYTASIWVRADTPGAQLKLQLAENDNAWGQFRGEALSFPKLTTSWQEVTVRYQGAVLPAGGSTLVLRASIYTPRAGTCLYVDDAALVFQRAPVAALTVTPHLLGGVAPLTVHADASASAVTERPIASYTFRFGDGTTVGPQPEPTADHTYLGSAYGGVQVVVTDTDGVSSYASSDSFSVSPGIVGNPTFDADTSGWNTSGSSSGVTLTQVAGGHSGASTARLANGGTAAGSCILNDAPNWVKTSAAGRYTASLWVRADAPGGTLKLKLREYRKDNAALVGSATTTTALTTSWQQVKIAYTPLAPRDSTLDYTASVGNVAAGSVCFDADDATIALDPVPAASLTVTPTGGTAPVTVRADASGSATPVASYRFDFGDGSSAVGPQLGTFAEHSYAAAGTYTVSLRVEYRDGESAVATRQVTVSPGIVGNPSFEAGTSGWNASGSGPGVTLSQTPGGYSGSDAARLLNGGMTPARCELNDRPNWVATTAAAGAYIASLWVRSDSPGRALTLRLREYRKDTGAFVGDARSAVTLKTSWQQIDVRYTPLAPGASTLDYTAAVDNAAAGSVCFDADDAAIAPPPAAAFAGT